MPDDDQKVSPTIVDENDSSCPLSEDKIQDTDNHDGSDQVEKANVSSENGKGKKILSVVIIVLMIAAVIIVAAKLDLTAVQSFIKAHEVWGVIAALALYGVLGFTFIPSEPLTMAISAVMGPMAAMIIATAGNTIAALFEYVFGGSIGNLSDFEKKKESLPKALRKLPANSILFLTLGRMVPWVGPKVVGLAGGIYHISVLRFTLTALPCNLLGASILAFGTTTITKLLGR